MLANQTRSRTINRARPHSHPRTRSFPLRRSNSDVRTRSDDSRGTVRPSRPDAALGFLSVAVTVWPGCTRHIIGFAWPRTIARCLRARYGDSPSRPADSSEGTPRFGLVKPCRFRNSGGGTIRHLRVTGIIGFLLHWTRAVSPKVLVHNWERTDDDVGFERDSVEEFFLRSCRTVDRVLSLPRPRPCARARQKPPPPKHLDLAHLMVDFGRDDRGRMLELLDLVATKVGPAVDAA
jgi:hypothetical protein